MKIVQRVLPAVVQLAAQILKRVRPHVIEFQHIDVLERIYRLPDLIDDAVLMLLSTRLGLGKTH